VPYKTTTRACNLVRTLVLRTLALRTLERNHERNLVSDTMPIPRVVVIDVYMSVQF
jgi:hypothetical protein